MSKVIELSINNFRGIKSFYQRFTTNFICLIGRGDSGKSTILEAISAALSPSWNKTFYDTDFHNCDISTNIIIQISLIDIPSDLLKDSKFGLSTRFLNPETEDIEEEPQNNFENVLTLRLTVDNNLEPNWNVISNNGENVKQISANDRAKLNCFIVSDYIDQHFTWNKGSPLYSLLRSKDKTPESERNNVVIESLRLAKERIDINDFKNLSAIENDIIKRGSALGVDLSNTHTTIDFRDLALKDGRICLHDENIPFRLKGKGSKRLASISIQQTLSQKGGITLIDEIEQGLEPDRIKLLARILKEENSGQTFITTHSREVVTELSSEDLIVIHKDKLSSDIKVQPLDYDIKKLQGVVRACPEAFFARKVVLCEGATEVGICKSLDKFRAGKGKTPMSFSGCAYIDGTGSEFVNRAFQISESGISVCVLCDSDDEGINKQKNRMRDKGIIVFDCDDNNSIEDQIFSDLSWAGILQLIELAMVIHNKSEKSLYSEINQNYSSCDLPKNWKECDDVHIRNAISLASQQKHISEKSKRKPWFKRISHGEDLGDILFSTLDKIDPNKSLKKTMEELSAWIDE